MNEFIIFHDNVMNYLEYLNYPDYVSHFEPKDVADTLAEVIFTCHLFNCSYKKTALIIFGLTMWKIKNHIGIVGDSNIH